MITDLRYALRLLVKSPWFTALTVLVLAGGLAISIYTYAALNMMFYRDLPLPDGGSIVRIGYGDWVNFEPLDAFELADAPGGSREHRRARCVPRFARARRRLGLKPQRPVARVGLADLRVHARPGVARPRLRTGRRRGRSRARRGRSVTRPGNPPSRATRASSARSRGSMGSSRASSASCRKAMRSR